MTARILLGVDVGTSDSKVLATTGTGAEVGLISAPTPWTVRPGGIAEADADLLADTVIGLMDRATVAAAGRLGRVEVAGVAITGMAEVGVLVDGAGRPVHPAIAWFDARGTAEMVATPAGFRAEFPGRTGLPVSSLASIAKLLWLRSHGVSTAGRRWLNLPEYLAHRLGGSPAGEWSLASRTGLLDQDGPGPWPAALDLLGARESLVPTLVSAGTPLGRVLPVRVPRALVGAAITVAGHDHLVAAVGCGVTGTDELFDSFGTADALVRSTAAMPPAAVRTRLTGWGITVVRHVLAGRPVLLGGTKAGLLLRRTLDLLGAAGGARRDELDAATLALIEATPPGPTTGDPAGVSVTGAAIDDGTLRIAVDGDGVGPAALWRAALDDGVREADRLLAAMAEWAGPVRRSVMAGGWIRMASVRAARSRALPAVEFSGRRQAGAFGAAVFAGYAVSVADAMLAAGDPTAIGIAAPSGPDMRFIGEFIRESERTTEELEITA
jgi:sugar (pentulose or hexulose) kinase